MVDLSAACERYMCREQVTTLRQQTAANVMDICWSRFDENLLAAGDFLWDTRMQVSQQHFDAHV